MRREPYVLAAAIAGTLGFFYSEIIAGLIRQWATDDNYSHGFVIVPLAAYFAFRRRAALRVSAMRPSAWGLLFIAGALVLYAAGIAGADIFLARLSLVPMTAGVVLFMAGASVLRVLAFPILFLVLMIPPPAIVFNDVTLRLQLLASSVGELVLRSAGVPVLRDGNVLELVGLRLEVAEACSGIRSLVSLLTIALALGEVGGCRRWQKLALAGATIPVAIVTNAARVAGTGLAANMWGVAAAQGVLHEASGAFVFAIGVAGLLAVKRSITRRGSWMPA